MQNLGAIIFDMDGTLADTEDIHRQAFNQAFEEFNIACHWDEDEYINLLAVSGGRERIGKYLIEHSLVPAGTVSVDELALEIHSRKSAIYRDKLLAGEIRLRPGVERLIREAHNNDVQLAIATSSSLSNVETLLTTVLGKSALGLFCVIVTCDSVETKKPSPAVYNYALEKLGISINRCVAIEDTRNGNLAAMAAGITTIITTHRFTTDAGFDGAALVVDQLGEPDSPMEVTQGNAHHHNFVDLKLLDLLLAGVSHGDKIDNAVAAG